MKTCADVDSRDCPLETPDGHWASFFGLDVADFLEPGLKVVPHVGLSDYQGAW
ncbi:hypothetical protein IAD21_00244 [Abditibacteriota bacterium]|nr:hypothetical protein IAD21_00244 [Abditibacteriota bacterium]